VIDDVIVGAHREQRFEALLKLSVVPSSQLEITTPSLALASGSRAGSFNMDFSGDGALNRVESRPAAMASPAWISPRGGRDARGGDLAIRVPRAAVVGGRREIAQSWRAVRAARTGPSGSLATTEPPIYDTTYLWSIEYGPVNSLPTSTAYSFADFFRGFRVSHPQHVCSNMPPLCAQ
jgi:hypothetical protein